MAYDTFVVGGSTCNFYATVPDRTWDAQSVASVRHIPWTNTNILNTGGQKEQRITLTLYIESETNLQTLFANVGNQGTLTYGEWSGSAYLDSVNANEAHAGLVAFFAKATWVKL